MNSYIIRRIANWRSYILHMLEARLSPADFKYARSVVLKALGDNGLKGEIEKKGQDQ